MQNETCDIGSLDYIFPHMLVAGLIPMTLRFDPLRSGTSGLFIAKIHKSPASNSS